MTVISTCQCGNEIEREELEEGTPVPCACGQGLVPYQRFSRGIRLKPLPEGWTEDGCPKCIEANRELERMAKLS